MKFWTGILSFSLVAVILVFVLAYVVEFNFFSPESPLPKYLPHFNAAMNLSAAVFILFGIRAIKQSHSSLHRLFMLLAFSCSSLFLLGYLTHHTISGDQVFGGQGIWRWIYFPILISHIIGSIICFPLVLGTFLLGVLGKFDLHRKWAPRTWPLWLFVSFSGVVVFLLLQLFKANS